MKVMSYRYDREKRKRRWYLGASIFLVVSFFTPLFGMIFDLIEKPLARNWERVADIQNTTRNFFHSWYGKNRIVSENHELKKEIEQLQLALTARTYQDSQIEKILGITNSESGVSGSVLAYDGVGYRDTLVINRGSRDGISIGDKVISQYGVSLGEISEVYDISARVRLFTHPESKFTGVLYPHNVSVEFYGYGNGTVRADLPREIQVIEEDMVYDIAQPGYIIGVVRKIVFDPRDPFKQVYVSSPINLKKTQSVVIIPKPFEVIEAPSFQDTELVEEDDPETEISEEIENITS